MQATCCWCGSALVLGKVMALEAWLCPQPACWRRQKNHALFVQPKKKASEMRCVNVPLPKQVEFRERPEKYVLFGGAAGPGKSHEARWAAYELCLTIASFSVLILRETFGELERTHMRMMETEQDQVGSVFTPSAHLMRFGTTKSTIELGHMEDAAAVRKYLSAEYDLIIPDEGSLYDPDALLSLSTRARSSKPQVRAAGFPKFWVPTNPGGPASQVLLDFFIDHTPDFDERPHFREHYKPEQWHFVPALLDDNPYLDPSYDAALAVEKPWRYQQLRYGNFRVFAGQFFPSWQESKHQKAIELPAGCRWFRSMDWGYNSPGCVLWWVVLPDGHLYIRSELKFQQDDVSEVRRKILARDKELAIKGSIPLFGDPAMQAKTGQKTIHGASIAEAIGCGYIPADNDRLNGWSRCHQILRDDSAGHPWLQVHPDCRYLIRSIPAAKSDKHNLDDVDCWVAGTPVLTPTGSVPIEQVQPGDVVETPVGPRAVTHAYLSGTSETAWVELADGRRLEGTPRHKIYVRGKGLVQLGNIERDDILQPRITWPRLLNIAVWCIAGTRAVCTTPQALRRFVTARRAYIARCGWMPDVSFLTAGMSITSMATTITTCSTTSTVSLLVRTDASTSKRAWPVTLDNGSRRGVVRTLDAPHFETTREKCASGRLNGNARAAIVRVLSARDIRRRLFARMSAQSAAGSWRFNWSARCAAFLSKLVAPRNDKCKHVRIVAVGHCADKKPVYNLTVEDARLFYAHSILSSNTTMDDHALDAWRYGAMSRQAPRLVTSPVIPPPGSPAAIMAKLRQKVGGRRWGRAA